MRRWISQYATWKARADLEHVRLHDGHITQQSRNHKSWQLICVLHRTCLWCANDPTSPKIHTHVAQIRAHLFHFRSCQSQNPRPPWNKKVRVNDERPRAHAVCFNKIKCYLPQTKSTTFKRETSVVVFLQILENASRLESWSNFKKKDGLKYSSLSVLSKAPRPVYQVYNTAVSCRLFVLSCHIALACCCTCATNNQGRLETKICACGAFEVR